MERDTVIGQIIGRIVEAGEPVENIWALQTMTERDLRGYLDHLNELSAEDANRDTVWSFVLNPENDLGHHASGNLWAANGSLFTHDVTPVVELVNGVFEIHDTEFAGMLVEILEEINADYFILA